MTSFLETNKKKQLNLRKQKCAKYQYLVVFWREGRGSKVYTVCPVSFRTNLIKYLVIQNIYIQRLSQNKCNFRAADNERHLSHAVSTYSCRVFQDVSIEHLFGSACFSDILERNNDYSDTLDFRRG